MQTSPQTVAAVALIVALAALGATAQTEPASTAPEAPATEAPATEAPSSEAPSSEAPSSEAAAPEAPPEEEFVAETFGDWELVCNAGKTNCYMFQVAKDSTGNPVVEFSAIKLRDEDEADIGVTLVSPLGTLLTAGIAVTIDGGEPVRYPFQWCTRSGCFMRFGLDDDSVNVFKRGNKATLTLRSIGLPDSALDLDLSLSGFTAAYEALVAAGPASTIPPAQ
jgi:invasion protein IalB